MSQVMLICTDIRPHDLSICHRLPKKENDKFRPLIVRFSNRKARSKVLAAKKILNSPELRDRCIFVNKHLTRQANTLFKSSRALFQAKKIAGCWTKNDHVTVKRLDGRVMTINNNADLDNL